MPADDSRKDPLLANVPEVEGFKVLGGVVIFDKLGEGGMGAVYRGRHLRLNVDVALKIMTTPSSLSDEARDNYVQRFLREAQTAAQVDHPNLIRVYDVNSEHGLHYLIMQMLEGESAGARLTRKKSLAEKEAVAICLGVAEGLAEAHRRGIVHRDIKPDNVMVGPDGRVRVLDLGLAKAVSTEDAPDAHMLTQADTAMGTPSFMSPEQFVAARDVTPATDVWSLGVMLFHLLAGKLPWEGNTVYVLAKVIQEDPPSDLKGLRPDASDEIRAIVERALKKKPEERYPDCGEMARELRGRLKALGVEDAMGLLADPEAGAARPPSAPGRDKLTSIARAVSRIDPGSEAPKAEASTEKTVVYAGRKGGAPAGGETLPTARIGAEGGGSSWKLALVVAVVLLGVALGGFAALRAALSTDEPEKSVPAPKIVVAPAGDVQRFDLGRGVTIRMIPIRAGRFTRGSLDAEPGRKIDESPALEVRISHDFLMSVTEVTQEQFERVTKRNPSNNRGPQHPVEQVTWEDATYFCKRLSRIIRKKCRLPTEAEWEYACRAGSTTAFSWGEAATAEMANYDASKETPLSAPGAARGKTLPVAQLPPNGWGLYDMHGNVAEWCLDWYAANYYAAGADADPAGPEEGENRVYRGGSWFYGAEAMRSACRESTWPTGRNSNIGFRVVAE